jgi:hypothetical protein
MIYLAEFFNAEEKTIYKGKIIVKNTECIYDLVAINDSTKFLSGKFITADTELSRLLFDVGEIVNSEAPHPRGGGASD